MIIGSGLIATAFTRKDIVLPDVCIYAAGVSNSTCIDPSEFLREKQRLLEIMNSQARESAFVYFGTCSVYDQDAIDTPYVKHKLEMEQLVAAHPDHLIIRLPQVAGRTVNPHTLLNFLYARISRSESFSLWKYAQRNIIDVSDVAAVTQVILNNNFPRNTIINIANPFSYSMPEIVSSMERVVGKIAIYKLNEKGSGYKIDTSFMESIAELADVRFGNDYLNKVLCKYYGQHKQ